MEKEIIISEEKFKQISNFFNTAYKDYLATRTLFNTGQLYRGAILANTTVEKYLKVFNEVRGKRKKTHSVLKLFEESIKFDQKLEQAINKNFIKFIDLAYNMRYFDNDIFSSPDKEFRLSIAQYKTLAELDYTVYILQNSWKVCFGDFQLQSMHHEHLSEKNKLLFENNYILNRLDKTSFIEVEQDIYRIKNIKNHGIYEQYFRSASVKNDGIFLFEDN